MDILNEILPIVIYILLIALIILLIILAAKSIKTLKKVDVIVDNVDKKVKSLDGVFEVIDFTSNKLSSGFEKVVGFISSSVEKVFKKNKKSEEDE